MSRGSSINSLKPEDILYGSVQRGPKPDAEEITPVSELWRRLLPSQQEAIAAIFGLEQSKALYGVGFSDEKTRWDISMICYSLLEGHVYEDKPAKKAYQAKITRLLVSAKSSGLIYSHRYPDVRHVRWKLTKLGEEAAELYYAEELGVEPPTA